MVWNTSELTSVKFQAGFKVQPRAHLQSEQDFKKQLTIFVDKNFTPPSEEKKKINQALLQKHV